MSGIIIVDLILLVLFLAAGSMADCVGLAFAAWSFIAVIVSLCIADACASQTPARRAQRRRRNAREQREWLEWRYAAERRKRQQKKR